MEFEHIKLAFDQLKQSQNTTIFQLCIMLRLAWLI